MRRLLPCLAVLLCSLPAFCTTLTYTGAVYDGKWSSPGNWNLGRVPQNGDDLLFPGGSVEVNDIPGLVLHSINAPGFVEVSGNGFTLTGGLTATNNIAQTRFYVDVTLGASQTWTPVTGLSRVTVARTLNVNGYTLTFAAGSDAAVQSIAGNGSITGGLSAALTVTGDGSFTGPIDIVTLNAGSSSMPGANLTGFLLTSSGATLGNVDVAEVVLDAGGVHTANGRFRQRIGYGNDPLAVIDVHGAANITGCYLAYQALPATGSHTIINNDGTDPVVGQFVGFSPGGNEALPFDGGLGEGRVFTVQGSTYRITYQGGDGNDVVITNFSGPVPTSMSLSIAPGTAVISQPVTLMATLSAPGGTPSGNVSFRTALEPLGSAPVVNGIATLTTTALPVGGNNITAEYLGNSTTTAATAGGAILITNASATVTATPQQPVVLVGQPIVVRIVAAPQGSATATPAGDVTISEEGEELAHATLVQGQADITLPPRPAGEHAFAVALHGTAGFFDATTAFAVTVVRPAVSLRDVGVTEGNGMTTVSVPLLLAARAQAPVIVNYRTIDASAHAGSDYLAASGSVTVPEGADSASIEVTILGDAVSEGDETFLVELTDVTGADLGRSQATVLIRDDDAPPHVAAGLVYALAEGAPRTLDLLTPAAGNGPFPLIVSLNAANGAPSADREASRGYAVARVTYGPGSVADVKAAVRWLRANAAQYRLDTSRIAVWGVGEGGALTALLGTTWNVASLDELSLGNAGESSRVAAVVDFYGAGTAAYVSSDDAAMLLVHGRDDVVVPLAQAEGLADALRAAGVEASVDVLEGAGHGGTAFESFDVEKAVDAFLDGRLRRSRGRAAGH
jgi:dienelactone hydrolase